MRNFRDLELAKERLAQGKYKIVIVKDSKFIYTGKERGIKPLYTALIELGEGLKGASLADKVIGKAAALFCKMAGFKTVYADLISDTALEVLKGSGIEYEYQEICPYILNRSKDGMCPAEKIASDLDDGEVLLREIGKFLESVE
ncbi:MAG TPA: DUF1893 domain-containing protein [Halanaerobiales bacterium]|nr:DUF1893 domain-containing protein [Halanaerobiales bacterium]